MDVKTIRLLYVTITNFGKVDINLPKQEKVGYVANVPGKIFHVKKRELIGPLWRTSKKVIASSMQ